MARLKEVCTYADGLLKLHEFIDFQNAHNGLQVENCGTFTKIGYAVDANLLAVCKSLERGVDLLIVHHGLFWEGTHPIIDNYYKLYEKCIKNNLAIYSAHLPLDAHEDIGNNAIITKKLGLQKIDMFAKFSGKNIGMIAGFDGNRNEFKNRLEKLFSEGMHSLEFGTDCPERIGIVSGSGGIVLLEESLKFNIDTIVTGEIKHSTFSWAQLNNINVYACGHYNTEVFGVQALAENISKKFSVECEFIDVPSLL